jgi:hypothetical protein
MLKQSAMRPKCPASLRQVRQLVRKKHHSFTKEKGPKRIRLGPSTSLQVG